MLKYQSLVYMAGTAFVCVESYESIFERMRDSSFRLEADEESGSMRWMAPIELTVRGEHGPLRLAASIHAITAVGELHENDQIEVDGA